MFRFGPAVFFCLFLSRLCLPAQTVPPQPQADRITFVNGEELTGELERADSSGVTFKSLMAGEITVKWDKVKALRTDKNFAVLPMQQKLDRRSAEAVVPQGKVTVSGGEITVATNTGQRTLPVAKADHIVSASEFNKAVNQPVGLFSGWTGAVSAAASLVRATQNSTTFSGAVHLSRSTPSVDWLPPRSRSLIDYSQTYGTNSQTGTSTIETNIFHAGAERDQYFSRRAFLFAAAAFDHNFSQGLALQQQYGAGLGVTLLKDAVQQLDIKADLHYQKQEFFDVASNVNLIGSTFGETYLRHLPHTIVLNENAYISPAWNNLNAYSAHGSVGLVFPVYRGFAFNVGAIDDYLNNAPAGSKKNSVQFLSGISYVFK